MIERVAVCADPRQGIAKKVLCVCWGNQLRSPTAAFVLSSEPYNFNARSCGLDPNSAVCIIDNVMVGWADEIVVMEDFHASVVKHLFPAVKAPIRVLGLGDDYERMQPELIAIIKERYGLDD